MTQDEAKDEALRLLDHDGWKHQVFMEAMHRWTRWTVALYLVVAAYGFMTIKVATHRTIIALTACVVLWRYKTLWTRILKHLR